jgi:hypothetical protein
MLAGKVAGQQMQAIDFADCKRVCVGDARRAQIRVPEHGREIQRQGCLAKLQDGHFAGVPAQQDRSMPIPSLRSLSLLRRLSRLRSLPWAMRAVVVKSQLEPSSPLMPKRRRPRVRSRLSRLFGSPDT